MQIVWIGLPKRRTPRRLFVSAYVSPRFDSTGVLADFPEMLQWPDMVNGLDFFVEFDGGETLKARKSPVDPQLWNELFRADTPVGKWVLPDHSNTIIHGFPVSNILTYVHDLYRNLAEQAATDFPPRSVLETFLSPTRAALYPEEFGEAIDYELRVKNSSTGKPRRAIPPGFSLAGMGALESDFLQADRFYRRPEQRQPYMDALDPAAVPDPPAMPDLDFGSIISLLADSPEILRRLGLIIDLELDYDPDSPAMPAQGMLRILPEPVTPGVDLRPRTKYLINDERFITMPRQTFLIDDGTLILDYEKELFEVYQVDIDGSAMKLVDLARTVDAMASVPAQTSQTPDQASVPVLRSGGFTVSANARAVKLIDTLDEQTGRNAQVVNDTAILGIEDVLRGYRLDVFDGDRWRSLHERIGDHVVLDGPGGKPVDKVSGVEDEGYVRATTATSASRNVTDPNNPNQAPSDDLYVHEAMFGWDGWSLAAPRPGKIIGEPDPGTGANTVDQEQPSDHPTIPLRSTYRVKGGTLPRLRYGGGYRLRARAVDLAGNGLESTPKDLNAHATEEQIYLRHEPVPQPAIVRRHPDTEGESVEHLVIRSNFDIAAENYVKQQYVKDAIAGAAHTYTKDSQRHVAPPKGSVQMAELDGQLDDAFGSGGDPGQVFKLARKEEGTFLDDKVVNINTGNKSINVLSDIKTVPDGSPLPQNRGDGLGVGVYIYRKGPNLTLPYLPDPMAAGATFYGLPAHENVAYGHDFSGTWPLLDPFRLVLAEGPLGVAGTPDELIASLPKAERRRVRISTLPTKSAVDKMLLWNLMSPGARTLHENDVVSGRHWMMTPYRYVELVHAVQQPLEEPTVQFKPSRAKGETSTGFTGTIGNDAKSTGRLDIRADWSEPIDRVTDVDADPTTDRVTGSAMAFGWDIQSNENTPVLVSPTKNRDSRHEFGDTKHRKVRYQAIATTRFREYFPTAITSDPAKIQRIGPEVELNVPSSARPGAPKVLYMVPTFRWEDDATSGGNPRRRRRGGGVRVYLARPWWSSGDNERLGVVLPPSPQRVLPDLVERGEFVAVETISRRGLGISAGLNRLVAIPASGTSADPYVTKAGQDPTWATGDPTSVLRISDFPLATSESGSGYAIAENTNARVAVAAHEVGWDADRKLWYCDIEINTGPSYFPFVRLALARFQPSSVSGVHVSPIVIGDFIQLAADRTATVVVDETSARVTVSGIGPHNIVAEKVFSNPFGGTPSNLSNSRTISVTVQRRPDDAIGNDDRDLEWTDVGSEVLLSVQTGRFVAWSYRNPSTTWQGSVPLPTGAAGSAAYRLLIREYEHFFTDFDPDEHESISEIIPGKPIGVTRSRIVYADTFTLG